MGGSEDLREEVRKEVASKENLDGWMAFPIHEVLKNIRLKRTW